MRRTLLPLISRMFLLGASLATAPTASNAGGPEEFWFPSDIDAAIPMSNLPRGQHEVQLTLNSSLANVPEVYFPGAGDCRQIARQITTINLVNLGGTDRFMQLVLERRPELAGLPLVLGDGARLNKAERDEFALAVSHIHESLRLHSTRQEFWKRTTREPRKRQTIAALTQIVAMDSPLLPGLIAYLGRYDRKESTRALARLAVFANEEWVHRAACAALQRRDTGPATDILVAGLRYP